MMLSSDMLIQKGDTLKITGHHNTTTLSFDIAKVLENVVNQ